MARTEVQLLPIKDESEFRYSSNIRDFFSLWRMNREFECIRPIQSPLCLHVPFFRSTRTAKINSPWEVFCALPNSFNFEFHSCRFGGSMLAPWVISYNHPSSTEHPRTFLEILEYPKLIRTAIRTELPSELILASSDDHNLSVVITRDSPRFLRPRRGSPPGRSAGSSRTSRAQRYRNC